MVPGIQSAESSHPTCSGDRSYFVVGRVQDAPAAHEFSRTGPERVTMVRERRTHTKQINHMILRVKCYAGRKGYNIIWSWVWLRWPVLK